MPIVKTDLAKKALVDEVAKRTTLPKEQIAFVYETLLKLVVESLEDGRSVYLQGLGKFDLKDVSEKKSNLLGSIIPAHKRIKFYPNYYLSKNIRTSTRET